jgi:hypothetical protein
MGICHRRNSTLPAVATKEDARVGLCSPPDPESQYRSSWHLYAAVVVKTVVRSWSPTSATCECAHEAQAFASLNFTIPGLSSLSVGLVKVSSTTTVLSTLNRWLPPQTRSPSQSLTPSSPSRCSAATAPSMSSWATLNRNKHARLYLHSD